MSPYQENSGIAQGTFLKRHRVPKTGSPGNYFTWEDLSVGQNLSLYGRTIKLIDCGAFHVFMLCFSARLYLCQCPQVSDDLASRG